MNYDVHIRKVETGEIRICPNFGKWGESGGPDATEASHYLWSDGNFECDCNRYLFFERAGGSEPVVGDHPCNSSAADQKYRVRITVSGTDEELFSDKS